MAELKSIFEQIDPDEEAAIAEAEAEVYAGKGVPHACRRPVLISNKHLKNCHIRMLCAAHETRQSGPGDMNGELYIIRDA